MENAHFPEPSSPAAPRAPARGRVRALVGLLLLGAALGAAPAAHAGPRLDREERDQLRHELRRQGRDEPQRGWPAQERGRRFPRGDGWQPGDARGTAPGFGPGGGRGDWRGAADGRGEWRGAADGRGEWRGAADGRGEWRGAADGRGEWRGPAGDPGAWRGTGRGRDWDDGRLQRQERYRMPPEEREQLRHMLREHRRGRRDD